MVADAPDADLVRTSDEREKTAQVMRGRILNVLPAATYHMDRFLSLTDVVVSDRTETACVETGPQPRLHLNEDFVSEYCQRDEHLLMLVMHELYHVILGHTRMFPRLTVAHNIVFDAVINSILCHEFPDDPYASFFRQVNPSDDFPSRLLRPPSGWPNGTIEVPPSASDKERAVISLLYGKRFDTVTYHEIFELLKEEFAAKQGDESEGDSKSCDASDEDGFVLLGDHDAEGAAGQYDDTAVGDPLLKDILRRVSEDWPVSANPRVGKGEGGRLFDFLMPKPRSPRQAFLRALQRLLARAQVLRPPPSARYGWKRMTYAQESTTVLRNLRDRHSHSREELLGETPVLFQCSVESTRLRWSPRNVAHVYVDVSGSMSDILPWLWAALEPLFRRGACRLYAFSTVVDAVLRSGVRRGTITSTGGTDIDCVFEHMLKIPASQSPERFVVLTDGWTGEPAERLVRAMKKRRIKMYVGLVGPVAAQSLRPFAQFMEQLPNPTSADGRRR